MFYNILNYPTAPPNNRDIILKEILNSYEPDLFMVCELESSTAATNILTTSLVGTNKNYGMAQFATNHSDTSTDSQLQQLVYYNSDYFILENQRIIITYIRDINHYTFILKASESQTNPERLEVFVTHLKASQGSNNVSLRLHMTTKFTDALALLDPDSLVIFAGDFNFYTSSESGYQKILDNSNSIIMKDVLNLENTLQSWHNNYSWKSFHTQSTRLNNTDFNGYGAGGGLDDRFDFIMLSENLLNSATALHYISNSYKSYGNNTNCFNKRIDNTNCSGNYQQELRNNLYQMSDHLPVILSLESTQTLSTKEFLTISNAIKITNTHSDALELTINNTLLGTKLSIYNILGQELHSTTVDATSININTSGFSSGFCYIKAEGLTGMLKFIIP